MRSAASVIALATLGTLALAGCSEHPQVVTFPQGAYRGKPDTPPWRAAAFNDDRAKWEHDVARRTVLQNEYERIR